MSVYPCSRLVAGEQARPYECIRIVLDGFFISLCKVIAPFKDTVLDETNVGAGARPNGVCDNHRPLGKLGCVHLLLPAGHISSHSLFTGEQARPYECIRIALDGCFLFRYAKFDAPFKGSVPDETNVGAGLPVRMG